MEKLVSTVVRGLMIRLASATVGAARSMENRVDHILNCTGYEVVKTGIVRARDCFLYDAEGNRYVDFEAGVWCAALGHGHERVNRVMRTQMEETIHLGYRCANDRVEEAAVEVLGAIPLMDGRCVFLSSGSEAMELAVQVARHLGGKPLLLTFTDSYVGAYGSAGSKRAEEWFCFDWRACAACPSPDACDPRCGRLGQIPFGLIGGFVFEPGNSGGLVGFPPKQLVRTLARRVKEQGALIVIDEVTTGMGRTGAWFGFQHYDLEPDVVVLGKGLGNGYPVSAVAMTRDVADRLEKSVFHWAQSHQNDPLGCSVAKEVIAVIREEGLVERAERVGANFLRELQRLAERHHAVKEVRGRGLMIAMELDEGSGLSAADVHRELLERGFLVGCKPAARVIRFYPPLTIAEDDIARLLEKLECILASHSGHALASSSHGGATWSPRSTINRE